MKRIILIGAGGFLGKSILDKLKNEKFDVNVIIHKTNVQTKFPKIRGNILLPNSLDNLIRENDIVINLVGANGENTSNLLDVNLLGGMNLLQSCMGKKNISVILASSINVYGENLHRASTENDELKPRTFYGTVKASTEKIYEYYSKAYGLNVIILRFAHLYGPHKKSGIIYNLLNSVTSKKQVSIYNMGDQLRDFLYVDDASDGVIQTIKHLPKGFKVFNISSGKRIMINDVIKIIENITKNKINVKMYKNTLDELCIWGNNGKARKLLDFHPKISIKTGLKLTLDLISL